MSRYRPSGAPNRGNSSTEPARIRELRLRDYRNFAELACEFPARGVAVIGPNGSGKTNLLESIYYLTIFRSFRRAVDAELVRLGQDTFRIEGTVQSGIEERSVAAAYQRSTRRKKVEIDGHELDRLSEAMGVLTTVAFSLGDVELVGGSPGGRRRFLDILLSLVCPGYMAALRRYRVVLAQRNEALRNASPSAAIEPWSEALVQAGAPIIEARLEWTAEQGDAFGSHHGAISGRPGARMSYRSTIDDGLEGDGASSDALADAFRRALDRSSARESQLRMTIVGPHRDDLRLEAAVADDSERDIRRFGSGGQQRTAALALRLVEADTLRDRTGRDPVYLLDDIFAELDRERSERLMRLLEEAREGQVILAAPKPADIGLRGGLEEWTIKNGELES